MGTFVEIGVSAARADAEQAVSVAFETMANVDRLMSFHQPESELSRLNRAGSEGMTVSAMTLEVLQLSRQLMQQTQGDFNCTIGGALVRMGILPQHDEQDFIDAGTQDDIQVETDRVSLRRPVRLVLDGIAKGYAVDRGVAQLRAMDIQHGWINAGGDIRVFGDYDLPVHRRELDGALTFLGRFANTAVATSSVSEAYDARFPGTIVDNSLNLRRGIWSVSAPQAWLADALTKVAAVTEPGRVSDRMRDFDGHLLTGLSL